MSRLLANNYRYRRSFGKTPTVMEVSNLIEIQQTAGSCDFPLSSLPPRSPP